MINQENPQVKTPNHKVSELHQFYGVGWGGGESQCWSTGTNECLRGADRQEHQSDKIKFFFVSYCYKILSRVWIDACSILTPVCVRGRGVSDSLSAPSISPGHPPRSMIFLWVLLVFWILHASSSETVNHLSIPLSQRSFSKKASEAEYMWAMSNGRVSKQCDGVISVSNKNSVINLSVSSAWHEALRLIWFLLIRYQFRSRHWSCLPKLSKFVFALAFLQLPI